MAIFHCQTTPIGRSAGRSAVAAAAYRAGVELVDERTGQVHDYTRKGGVVSAELVTPDGQAADRGQLWNAAEAAEKRKDARVAREWRLAIPAELRPETDPRRRELLGDPGGELVRAFAGELAARYGVAVDVAIHAPDRGGDQRNWHAHLLVTTRQVSRDAAGALALGDKASIELSDSKRRSLGLGAAADEIESVRELWASMANRALEQAGHAARIDHRSLEAQGIDREPTTHLGPVATEMERRGVASDRGDSNRSVAAGNQERNRLKAEIIDLQAEKARRAAQERPTRAVDELRQPEPGQAPETASNRPTSDLAALLTAGRDMDSKQAAAALGAATKAIDAKIAGELVPKAKAKLPEAEKARQAAAAKLEALREANPRPEQPGAFQALWWAVTGQPSYTQRVAAWQDWSKTVLEPTRTAHEQACDYARQVRGMAQQEPEYQTAMRAWVAKNYPELELAREKAREEFDKALKRDAERARQEQAQKRQERQKQRGNDLDRGGMSR